jgi:two-component system, NtrC family, nitrogen regulation response regulator GlnG
VMTAHPDLGSAVCAYESGAFEYLSKLFDIDEGISLVLRAARPALAAKTGTVL